MALVIVNESSMELDEQQVQALVEVAAEAVRTAFEPEEVEVGVTLVDDEAIAALNEQYRSVAGPTDVLSFPLWTRDQLAEVRANPDKYPERPLLLGDVVISLETARRQAEEYGHSFGREVAFLLVHGILHLLGYDHEDDESRAEMRAKEEAVLEATGWPR